MTVLVQVELLAYDSEQRAEGTFVIERRRGSEWVRDQSFAVEAGLPGADRRFILDSDQRLVVEGKSNIVVVYDPKQMAAVSVVEPKSEAQEDQEKERVEAERAAQEQTKAVKREALGLIRSRRLPHADY